MNPSNSKTSRALIPSIKELNDPKLAELLTPPKIAWLTLLLFFSAIIGWLTSGYLGITGAIPTEAAVALSAITAYWSFTVLHDASHRAVIYHVKINDVIGRIATMPIIVIPIFPMFRFVHMQHHRFTNEMTGLDPDSWVCSGPKWLLPFRWATLDLYYFYFYYPKLSQRPKKEIVDFYISVISAIALLSLIIALGYGEELFLFWILPSRISILFLAITFDYLPHIPKKSNQLEDPFQASNIRLGMGWLFTPLLFGQNYHLVHHLYPLVPFYRYHQVWHAGKDKFKEKGALVLKWYALKE